MTNETVYGAKKKEGESQIFRIKLTVQNAEFLRGFVERRSKIAEKALNLISSSAVRKEYWQSIVVYTRLANSLSRPLSSADSDSRRNYGVDYQDFLAFAREVERYDMRLPGLLRSLVELNDSFVEAGAIAYPLRDEWEKTADHIESDFELWRKTDPSTLNNRR